MSHYSNASVIDRIVREEGVDAETARRWFDEMLVFLDMAAESDEFISPPEPVDKAWHAFLLHTRDYEAYCKERFGRVIHHQPTDDRDPLAYRRAYERRSQMGTTPDPLMWAVPAGLVTGGFVEEGTLEDGGGGFFSRLFGGGDSGGSGSGGSGDSGGGFFSGLFGGSDSGSGDSGSGDSGSGGGDGGGSSCGGGGCGGGGGS